MKMMKTCPICQSKAATGARTCFECYYRFSDRSTKNVQHRKPIPATVSSTLNLHTVGL